MREQLLSSLRDFASQHGRMPSLAELAAVAGMAEPGVREQLGPEEGFPALLAWQPPSPAQETRERILQSAAAVFARKGFERSTLDAVAADAGMTKGAIYWHFKSKNDLFFALLDQRLQLHTSPLKVDLAVLMDSGQDPQAGMLGLFREGMQRCIEDPVWAPLYLECLTLGRSEEVRERLSAFYDQVWAVSAHFTRELQSRGMAPEETDPHTAAIFWGALFDGLMLAWLVKGGELDLDSLLPGIFQMLWQGIAVPANKNNAMQINEIKNNEIKNNDIRTGEQET